MVKKYIKRNHDFFVESYSLDFIKNMIDKKQILYYKDRKVSFRRTYILHNIGFQCQHCVRKGVIWRLSLNNANQLHLDLFSDDGIMMTLDHIVPRSKGGKNKLYNYQCLCSECNRRKGNRHCN